MKDALPPETAAPVICDPDGTVYATPAGSTQSEVNAMSPERTLPYAPEVVPGAVAVAPPANVTGPSAATLYAASNATLQLNAALAFATLVTDPTWMVLVSPADGLTNVTAPSAVIARVVQYTSPSTTYSPGALIVSVPETTGIELRSVALTAPDSIAPSTAESRAPAPNPPRLIFQPPVNRLYNLPPPPDFARFQ